MFGKGKKKDPNAPPEWTIKLRSNESWDGTWYVYVYKDKERVFSASSGQYGPEGLEKAREIGEEYVDKISQLGGLEYKYEPKAS